MGELRRWGRQTFVLPSQGSVTLVYLPEALIKYANTHGAPARACSMITQVECEGSPLSCAGHKGPVFHREVACRHCLGAQAVEKGDLGARGDAHCEGSGISALASCGRSVSPDDLLSSVTACLPFPLAWT